MTNSTEVQELSTRPKPEKKAELASKLKILVALPTFGLDPNPGRWLTSLLITLQDLRRAGVDYGFCFQYRKNIHKAENQIIKTALVNGYTHILHFDDDIWGVEPGDIIKLLNADKDFISAVMYVRGFPYSRCAFNKVPECKNKTLFECEKIGRHTLEEVDGAGVVPVDLTAFPYTLIKTEVYTKMKYPWFDVLCPESPDAQFCQKCADVGVQPYVHMDIQISHQEVTPWNRLFLFNCDARRLMMQKKFDLTRPDHKMLVEMFGEDGTKDLYTLKGTGRE